MGDLAKRRYTLEDLTANQLSFYEFFTDIENEDTFRNATASLRASSYATDNYDYTALRIEAHKLRHHPKLAPLIESRLREYYSTAKMSQDEALARQSDLGRFDLGDILEVQTEDCECCGRKKGHVFVDIERAQRLGLTRFLKKISYDRTGNQVFEFHDPVAAQDRMLKAAGAYQPKEKIEATTLLGAMLAAKAAMDREDEGKGFDADFEVVE